MSSIEGLCGSSSFSMVSMIQQLSASTTSAATGESSETESVAASNENGIDALKSKMDAAISEALGKLDKSASAEEIMGTVKSAIDGVMEANGLDPEAMKAGARPPEPPEGAEGEMGGTPPPPAGASGMRGNNDDFMSKVESMLEANGFDVEKFRSELASYMNGDSDGSGLTLASELNSTQGIDTQA